MSKVSKLTGTVWHVEKMNRMEGDERRHRSRCKYYAREEKNTCEYYVEKCHGASHCDIYCEEVDFPTNSETTIRRESSVEIFEGVKYVRIKQIFIDPPKKKKVDKEIVEEIERFYNANGRLDQPLHVSKGNYMYCLEESYERLYVAKKLKLSSVPIEMGDNNTIEKVRQLRKIGTRVHSNKLGKSGVVTCSDWDRTTIEYEDNQQKIYVLSIAAKRDDLQILNE